MKNIFALLALGLAITTSAHARDLTREEKLSDVNQLLSMVYSGYGPLQYKQQVRGMDLNRLAEKYRQLAVNTQSNGEFYYLLEQLIAEFQDSHFGISVPTKQIASVPFSTDLVQGRVLIDAINRKKLPEDQFKFQKGDEIVSINGVPASQALDQLQKYVGAGYELTARRKAAMLLTYRPGRSVPVPQGDVKFQIRRGDSQVIDEASLKWNVDGDALDEVTPVKPQLSMSFNFETPRNYDQISVADYWNDVKRTDFGPEVERDFRCSGTTRIEIPKDATIIMMDPFVAYYHPTAKGNVGYLRIPHYIPQNPVTGADEYELRFHQYEYAISVLEKNTVGLIIDQDHNCGGSVEWLHQVAGLFIQKPFEPMQFQLLANKAEYLDFKGWADKEDEHTLTHQLMLTVADLIRDAWFKGDFMTKKTSIDGSTLIQPHSIQYTKPIVMLIDEMSGSGGDGFPAIMQGNGRATLLGTRTMGAGGHVTEQPDLFYSRMNIRMTKSLFYRPDGVPVENNGSVPNVPYTITADDFRYGYRGYQAFYLNELFKKLP